MNGEIEPGYSQSRSIAMRWGGALLWASGAFAMLSVMMNGSGDGRIRAGVIAAMGGISLVLGSLFLSSATHFSTRLYHLIPGMTAITIVVAGRDAPSMSVGILVLAPVLFAAYFFSLRASWINYILIGILYFIEIYVENYSNIITFLYEVFVWGCVASLILIVVVFLRSRLREIADGVRIDVLTGLRNYSAFREFSAYEVARCDRSGPPMSILLIGIDNFNDVCEAHGWGECGSSIRRMGDLLRTQTRSGDVLARVSTERFAILLPACGSEDAIRRADHIRSLVYRTSMTWPHPMTVSVGIATAPGDGRNITILMEVAESAMNQSHRDGP